MAREVVSTRIELDHRTDTTIREITKAELRNSKRETASVLLTRIARLWANNPQSLRDVGIVRD